MYKVGDKVRAKQTVTEDGHGIGDESAVFPQPQYIHAREGELGEVVHVEPSALPTVMFERTKTATIVRSDEVELVE
jgi:hypothetical protein